MFATIVSQTGTVPLAMLIGTVLLMLVAAHYLSFRQALAAGPYDWKSRPVLSVIKLLARHQINYHKRVPVLIGCGLLMTIAVFYL